VTAARHAPKLEDALEKAMLKGIAGFEKLAGSTGLVVDVSGSMNYRLSKKGETTRMDAASGLSILLREKAEDFTIATFSDACVELPPRRGFALRDAIVGSQAHSGTYLKRALTQLHEKREWSGLERLIVITDEQSHDGILAAWTPRAYVVNVAPYKHGISYGHGWTHVDGWSERIVDYIAAVEAEAAAYRFIRQLNNSTGAVEDSTAPFVFAVSNPAGPLRREFARASRRGKAAARHLRFD
jgi:hypothetical protein